MEQLRPGLWTWTAPHPDWTPADGGPEGWEHEVRSYAFEAEESLVIFDPLAPPAQIGELADGRSVSVLLTCRWHQRSAEELHESLAATVYAPAQSVPEVRSPAEPYEHGDTLPGGIVACAAGYPDEASLWLPAAGALVFGDVFLGGARGFRLQPDSWLAEGLTHDAFRDLLLPLLELPVELLLPTHGDPVTENARDALERALAP